MLQNDTRITRWPQRRRQIEVMVVRRVELNRRQAEILDWIQTHGEAKISELRDMFAVAEMTIRRDLDKLKRSGLVRRTFGGAIPVPQDVSLMERHTVMHEQKMEIGKVAAELIQPEQSIFVDAGTTTAEMARNLKSESQITVVTNALNVASILIERQIHTIMVGGMLMEKTMSLVGPIAIEALQKMAFDQVFLGSTGLTIDHGFSNSNVLEAEVKKTALRHSSVVNIVLDHSKFGVKQLVSFATLADVNRIITDQVPPQDLHGRQTRLRLRL